MSLFNLMAREQERIEAELAGCVAAPQSSRLKGADVAAVRRAARYLRAQCETLYPALIALNPDRAEEPALCHERLSAQAQMALSRCGGGDGRAAAHALRELLRQWHAHGAYEQGSLRAACARLFSAEELRQLAGEMLLELRVAGSSRARRGLWQALHAWWWRLQQRVSGARTLPRLRDAVFVYRAN